MSADYLSADYSCIMVNYVKGSKAVGDRPRGTVCSSFKYPFPLFAVILPRG